MFCTKACHVHLCNGAAYICEQFFFDIRSHRRIYKAKKINTTECMANVLFFAMFVDSLMELAEIAAQKNHVIDLSINSISMC